MQLSKSRDPDQNILKILIIYLIPKLLNLPKLRRMNAGPQPCSKLNVSRVQ